MRITRRAFMLFGGAALFPFDVYAQGKPATIGFLSPAAGLLPVDKAFLAGLGELGYIEGKNIIIEYRFANGDFGRLPELAHELVDLDVSLIVARVTQASLAAKEATGIIPIVMLGVSDPIGSGLAASLARPGNNVTGTSSMHSKVIGKSLEILLEIVPAASRIAVLWNPDNEVFQRQLLDEAQKAATALGLDLATFGAKVPDEIGQAFAAIGESGSGGLLVLGDPILIRYQQAIIDHANEQKLPAIFANREAAETGGLISFGPNMSTQFRRAAFYVDRILKGAAPADIPIEQATEFELIINLVTAETLGLAIPDKLLARADQVIE